MNADPRRPDKIQRYTPTKNNANGEDLTPDYMNIMGQPSTTANAAGEPVEKYPEPSVEPNPQARPDDVHQLNDELTVTSNAANVIPTSPQYGLAIIQNNVNNAIGNDLTSESITMPTDSLADASGKPDVDPKDLHSTPSRNDRFKVVKIASLEPFKRGRWKCMDYVDEAPPANLAAANTNATKAAQSVGNTGMAGGGYMQTQSLPQQQIQQMLLQGGFTNGSQFITAMPAHLIPQGQYFYPQVQGQTVPQPVATSMPTQFINNQPYFAAGVVANPGFALPQGYPNIQYVPIPAQNSAFVPTSQAVHLPPNFQQSQTYAGQPTSVNQNQPMMNGHSFPRHGDQPTMPNQPAKNVIANSQPVTTQPQQNHVQNPPAQSAPVVPTQQYQQQGGAYQAPPPSNQPSNQAAPPTVVAPVIGVSQASQPQNFDASNVYTNPQFTMSVNSLTVLDPNEAGQEVKETNSGGEAASDNADDPTKNNPVVNAIDNKIEQAMDLVKSHLMYTVREEVEVLKEKIVELMERIHQLETENNFLRIQNAKNQGGVLPPPPTTNFGQQPPLPQPPQPQNIAIVQPSPSVVSQKSNPAVPPPVGGPGGAVPTNSPSQSQAIPTTNTTAIHQPSKEPSTGI